MKQLKGSIKRRIWRQDKFRCQLRISPDCIPKLNIENATVDHKVALVNKGKNDIDNLQTACRPCNQLKAIKDQEEKIIRKYKLAMKIR